MKKVQLCHLLFQICQLYGAPRRKKTFENAILYPQTSAGQKSTTAVIKWSIGVLLGGGVLAGVSRLGRPGRATKGAAQQVRTGLFLDQGPPRAPWAALGAPWAGPPRAGIRARAHTRGHGFRLSGVCSTAGNALCGGKSRPRGSPAREHILAQICAAGSPD